MLKVQTPVKYGKGKRLPVGATAERSDFEAKLGQHEVARLIGFAALVELDPEAALDPEPGITPDQNDAAIKELMAKMLQEDPDKKSEKLWLSTGKPEIKYIEAQLKVDLNADKRDALWAEVAPSAD